MSLARPWPSPLALAALLIAASLAPAGAAHAGVSFADPIFEAMKAELGRASEALQFDGAPRPYRIACSVLDASVVEVRAQAGAIIGADHDARRQIDVDVRVGDYAFDNSNFDSYGGHGYGHGGRAIPVEDDLVALRRAIWLITDESYKDALRSMSSKEAFLRNRPKAADGELLADYTRISPVTVIEPARRLDVDLKTVEALARDLARLLRDEPTLTHTGVVITAGRVRRRQLDTEGSRADTTSISVRLVASASAMADDGTTVIDAVDFVAPSMAALPPRAELEAAVKALAARVAALRVAPLIEDYDGPVLFEGVAAAQVMRHFLASNLSGTPAPVSAAGSGGGEPTFARKMDRPVMPKGWGVVDDPTLAAQGEIALIGHYKIDHEGVEPRRVELIKDGRLVAQLASRIPSKHQEASSGHGRAPSQARLVGHPGNLIVQSRQGSAPAALGKALLKLANDEGYDKALVVRRLADDALYVTGAHVGSPMASMGDFPRPTWAVMVDAKGQETLVRGVTLNHVILRNLRDIAASSREPVVYNYLSSGVESGASFFGASGDPVRAVPTSIVTPAFILPHVEVSPDKGEARNPPLVPRPERR